MTLTFLSERELLQQYSVHGHFYELPGPGGIPLKCRSVLEITAKATGPATEVDAVFVMMNPGSSQPAAEMAISSYTDQRAASLVPTIPDKTQYQLMRVMYGRGWTGVRVINLSDLCEPDSREFVRLYRRIEQLGIQEHSIFSPGRAHDLELCLQRKVDGPVVCAWGVDSALNTLIERARKNLDQPPGVIGWPKASGSWSFFHPLQRCRLRQAKWVAHIQTKLDC